MASDREQKATALEDMTSHKRTADTAHMLRNVHGQVVCIVVNIKCTTEALI